MRGNLIQVARGHTRLRLVFERVDGLGHDLARLAHDGDLARRLEDDRIVGSWFQVHRPRECITERARVVFLLGLTGNIACGKSTVGQLLVERYGAYYVDADRLVHALYAAGTAETRAIAERFGHDLLTSDGTIDRRRLGDMVLSDRAAVKDLEAILNPGVRLAILNRIAAATAPVMVLDA